MGTDLVKWIFKNNFEQLLLGRPQSKMALCNRKDAGP